MLPAFNEFGAIVYIEDAVPYFLSQSSLFSCAALVLSLSFLASMFKKSMKDSACNFIEAAKSSLTYLIFLKRSLIEVSALITARS